MKTAEELTNELKEKLGNNLVSAILYGSTVVGDATKKFSDQDVFLLVKDAGLQAMAPAMPALRKWMKQGHKPPLLFSASQLERAADVFPIEFSDIKSQRRVLAGSDPFSDMAIERGALRHQLEFELRTNLLRLRRHYLESGDQPAALAAILAQSLSTFSALFRSTLRLLGSPAPAAKNEVWQELSRHVAIDMAAIEKIWDLRDNGFKPTKEAVDALYEQLSRAVESVIDFVDLQQ